MKSIIGQVFLSQGTSITDRGIEILYVLIAAVLAFLWIQLLRKKRKAEKANVLMYAVLFFGCVTSLVLSLTQEPVDRVTVTVKAVLLLPLSVFLITEWVCYRKNPNQEDTSE